MQRRYYTSGRSVWPARLALAGIAVAVLALMAAIAFYFVTKSPGHNQRATGTHQFGAQPAAPMQAVPCSKVAPGSPQYVACQVTANCFKYCASPDPATFLVSVRALMELQAASDLENQASFANPRSLRSSTAIAASSCIGQCSLQVQVRSAALSGQANAPPVKRWMQYVLKREGGRWLVSSVVWGAGGNP